MAGSPERSRRSGTNWPLAAGLVLLMGLLVVLFVLIAGGNSRSNWNWYETYRPFSDEPYGTSLLRQLLGSYSGGEVQIIDDVNQFDFETANGTWFFLGNSAIMEGRKLAELIDFAERGNTVYLAAWQWPDTLIDMLGANSSAANYVTEDSFSREIWLNFDVPELAMSEDHRVDFWFNGQRRGKYWSLLNPFFLEYVLPGSTILGRTRMNTENWSESGDHEGQSFLVSTPVGSGKLVLHTIPLIFTNYYITQPAGLDFAERCLAPLPEGDIFWDVGSNLNAPPPEGQEGPLRFILSQPSLRWSWYMLVVTTVLFLLFRTRRRQKAIALMDPKTNTTLEYVNTVSQLHFKNDADHKVVAMMMASHFLGFLRERYHMTTSNLDSRFIDQLIRKSGVDRSKVEDLVRRISEIEGEPEVGDYLLQRLHRRITDFQRQCQ